MSALSSEERCRRKPLNNSEFLGIVEREQFKPLLSDHEVIGSFRLTTISTQAAETPESGEITLSQYEGRAIIVRGVENGDWIYGASIVEQAGEILTAVVRRSFGLPDKWHSYRPKQP